MGFIDLTLYETLILIFITLLTFCILYFLYSNILNTKETPINVAIFGFPTKLSSLFCAQLSKSCDKKNDAFQIPGILCNSVHSNFFKLPEGNKLTNCTSFYAINDARVFFEHMHKQCSKMAIFIDIDYMERLDENQKRLVTEIRFYFRLIKNLCEMDLKCLLVNCSSQISINEFQERILADLCFDRLFTIKTLSWINYNQLNQNSLEKIINWSIEN